MTSDGYWVNNEVIIFKNIIKPCKFCGFCPYGQLVEDFPVPSISRKEAIAHNEYMKKALADGTFDKEDSKNPFLMSRECAEIEINEFNEEDYPESPNIDDEKMRCNVFGHHCPVYYHGELLAEDSKATQDEIDAFEKEAEEFLKKVEEYHKSTKEGNE